MSTGPTPAVRALVSERDRGRCVRCGWLNPPQVHHRRPRGMGGSDRPDTNQPQNLLSVCADCHAWIETHRHAAIAAGWLVPQLADPLTEPVQTCWFGWVVLHSDGTLTRIVTV